MLTVYTPIHGLIDMGQSGTLDILYSARIEFGRECNQRCINAAETILASGLRKAHHHKQVSAFELDGMSIAIVSLYALVEFISWYERHNLSEYGHSLIHDYSLLQYNLQKYKIKSRKSNSYKSLNIIDLIHVQGSFFGQQCWETLNIHTKKPS